MGPAHVHAAQGCAHCFDVALQCSKVTVSWSKYSSVFRLHVGHKQTATRATLN